MRLIKKKALHEEIVETLRDMIMTGELQEGDKINENALCASMGISKTPLREALRVLSAEKIIKLVPNKGSYVCKPTLKEIKEMFDVMSVLEGICARSATEKMTDRDFARLEKLHEKLEENFKSHDQKNYIKFNNLYHTFLQELAGNQTLNQIIYGLRQKILLYRFKSLNLPGRFEKSIQEHRQLLNTFQKRDPEKAEILIKTHLKNQSYAVEKLSQTSSGEEQQEISIDRAISDNL
ncbi:MAG: GntR family transcriptional regulator [Deltaproteobacteria bacterium]|nr:GntR family transcriptional regulator [Deltaproteobacteria bacterium]